MPNTPRASLGRRRLVAWLIDWACILVWVAITAAIGLPLYLAGIIAPTGYGGLNLIAALVVVVPVVVGAAWFESRSVAATPGKRVMRLRVRTAGGRPSFQVALLRNALKIGVPWLIGHAAVFAIVASSGAADPVPAWVWLLTGAAYLIPLIWIGSLFVAGGRTPYDRATGTDVVRDRLGAATS
ncbi:MAG TPA: RDD family protein [Agromyces sp.]